jgi:hypothetical protein
VAHGTGDRAGATGLTGPSAHRSRHETAPPPKRAPSRKLASWSHGEVCDGLLVGLLGIGQAETAVDLQGLAAGMTGVRLEEGVVEAP